MVARCDNDVVTVVSCVVLLPTLAMGTVLIGSAHVVECGAAWTGGNDDVGWGCATSPRRARDDASREHRRPTGWCRVDTMARQGHSRFAAATRAGTGAVWNRFGRASLSHLRWGPSGEVALPARARSGELVLHHLALRGVLPVFLPRFEHPAEHLAHVIGPVLLPLRLAVMRTS